MRVGSFNVGDLMTGRLRPVVHVVGSYVPMCTGLDAIEEIYTFRGIFWRNNFAQGAGSNFLMGQKGDQTFSAKYVEKEVRSEDVIVLLNPTGDTSSFTYLEKYVGAVRAATEKVGRERLVLAFQDREISRRVRSYGQRFSQLVMWEINYAPITIWKGSNEEVCFLSPVPEESMNIVRAILQGEDLDVYKEPV